MTVEPPKDHAPSGLPKPRFSPPKNNPKVNPAVLTIGWTSPADWNADKAASLSKEIGWVDGIETLAIESCNLDPSPKSKQTIVLTSRRLTNGGPMTPGDVALTLKALWTAIGIPTEINVVYGP